MEPNYVYPTSIDWGNWWSWNQASAFATGRAYDYVHVAAAYWALYRVARNYPALVTTHTWQWYINQAVNTIKAMMSPSVGFNTDGLMGETVFRLLLDDLNREGLTANATFVQAQMKTRWTLWSTERYPFVTFYFRVQPALSAPLLASAPRWLGIRMLHLRSTELPDHFFFSRPGPDRKE